MLTASATSSGYTGASGSTNAGLAARTNALSTGTNGSAYFEVTVTPNANVTFALTGISFGSRSTGTGPQAFTLRSSADGYNSEITSGTLLANTNWAFQAKTNLAFSAQTGTTFRLYGYAGTGSPTTGTANWRIDDLKMTVSTEVPAVTPVITSTNAVTATNYAALSYQITASNSPVSYNASGLPNGLSINTSNGLISGTPAVTPGTYTIGLSAINSAWEGTKNLTLAILKNLGAPTITSGTNATAYLRSAFSFTATASPTATAWTFAGLPSGLTNSGSTISGTPTASGTFSVGITATNSLGSDSQTLSLTVMDPALRLSTNSLSGFSSILGQEGAIQSYTISGSSLTNNITVTAPAYFTVSLDSVTFTNSLTLTPSAGTLSDKTIFTRLAANAPQGVNTGTITHSGGGAITQNLSVAGNVIQPQLSLSASSLAGFSTRVGVASASRNYTISGTELTGGITITPPAGFELSTDNSTFGDSLLLIPSSGTLSSSTIYVRISSAASLGALAGSITHEGGDAPTQSLSLSGEVVQPVLTLSAASLSSFNAIHGSASTSQSYTVSGSHLTGPITITAPANFELSLNNSSFAGTQTLTNSGTLTTVPVYVRVGSNAPVGSLSGVVTHTGGDAATQNLSVSGSVISITPTIGLSVGSLSGFTTVAGTPSLSQNYAVSGVNLSNTVTLTAPVGFEVASDNINFGSSLSLNPSGGSLSNALIYVQIGRAHV